MADGDVLSTNPGIRHIKLLDAADISLANNGVWVDMGEWTMNQTIHASGIANGGIISIRGSLAATIPANTDDQTELTLVDADKVYAIPPARWVKAKVQTKATSSTTASVFLMGVRSST